MLYSSGMAVAKQKNFFGINKFRSWLPSLILAGILIFGGWLRLAIISELPDVSLMDGGRDLLIAKWQSEGDASWTITPKSGLTVLPNTPIYFLINALAYGVIGLYGPVFLNIILGILVIWLTYQIVIEFGPSWIGLIVSFQAAISLTLIYASRGIWQPNTSYFFGSLLIFLTIKALIAKNKPHWYLLALPAIFIAATIHNAGLPIALFTSTLLIYSWWKNLSQEKLDLKLSLYILSILGSWSVWWYLAYGMLEKNLISSLNGIWSLFQLINFHNFSRILDMSNYLLLIMSYYFRIPSGVGLCLLAVVVFGLWSAFKFGRLKSNLVLWFFMLIILSLGLAFFITADPGERFRTWYLSIQYYLIFILLGLTPTFLGLKKPWIYIVHGFLVFYQLVISWPMLKLVATPEIQDTFQQSQEVAKLIDQDARMQYLFPNNFGLIVNRSIDSQGFNLNFLRTDYKSSSVQLALENLDDRYKTRIKIVPLIQGDGWSNYLQPAAKVTYVICQYYAETNRDKCFEGIVIDEKNIFSNRQKLVGEVASGPNAKIYLYRWELN